MGDSQLSMWYSLSKVDCLSGVKQTSLHVPCASSDKLIDFSWLSLDVLFQPHGRRCQCAMHRDLPVEWRYFASQLANPHVAYLDGYATGQC